MSHEQTFGVDEPRHAALELEVRAQADAVAKRLRRAGLVARTVSIKLRWADFTTVQRSRTLTEPTDTGRTIFRVAAELLDEVHDDGRPVRLIGVRAGELVEAGSATGATLWSEHHDDEWEAAERAVDQATERFGLDAVRPASLLGRRERRDGRQGLTERPNAPGASGMSGSSGLPGSSGTSGTSGVADQPRGIE